MNCKGYWRAAIPGPDGVRPRIPLLDRVSRIDPPLHNADSIQIRKIVGADPCLRIESGLSHHSVRHGERHRRRIASRAALALFGGVFHWSFALLQVPVGLALDIFGVRRTVIALSGFAVLGGAICALAPDINWLFLGQLLIGIGCAPAFMAAIVFTSKHWPVGRFAAISGFVLAIGSGGMLLSATPLAWFIERWSWRI